jgi:hypothetical protein
MKTLLFILLFVPSLVIAGDIDSTLTTRHWFKDTLTATVDTIDITFSQDYREMFEEYTIIAWDSTDYDTVNVYTLAEDNATWVLGGLVDLTDNSSDAAIIVTTTPKEFKLNAYDPKRIRLLTPDGEATCRFIIAGKKGK